MSNHSDYPPCDWPDCTEQGRTINQGLHPALMMRMEQEGDRFAELLRKDAMGGFWLCYIHGRTPVEPEVPEPEAFT